MIFRGDPDAFSRARVPFNVQTFLVSMSVALQDLVIKRVNLRASESG